MSFKSPFEQVPAAKEETAPAPDETTEQAPQRRGLPRSAVAPQRQQDAVDHTYAAFFEDDDEEITLAEARAAGRVPEYKPLVHEDRILDALAANYDRLKKRYPTGGVKTIRFLTADILAVTPPGYFEKYDEVAKEATRWVQSQIAERERSDAIAEAQANPTDDSYQDDAFRVIYDVYSDSPFSKRFSGITKYLLLLFVTNEIIGFSKIDPLWRDRKIDEIIMNGPRDIQIEVSGKLLRMPAVTFRDEDHIMVLLERLFASLNKTLSKTTPITKGRLHDQSRLHAVHTSVAPAGPNVNIRRHPDRFWTAKELVERHSMSEEVATFLGNLIYKGCSFVIIGGTSTGKTSFFNAMTGFYPNDERLVTIEDNLEMKPNPTKALAAAMEAKPPTPDRPGSGVSMRDLVKASLQMRPDGILIGEVTDGAAYDLVQALNTGHFGGSTIHANSEYDGIYRVASLIQQGAELSQAQTLPLIAAAFDFIVMLESFPVDGSRKVSSISEVDPYVQRGSDGQPTLGVNRLFHFESSGTVEGKLQGQWVKDSEISETRRMRRRLDMIPDLSWEELVELSAIPPEFQAKEDDSDID